MKQSFLLNFSLSEWVKRLWTAKNQGIKNSKQEHFFPVPPTGSELFSTGGRQETSVCVFSFSYMSGCLFSEPRTLSCPQISPGSIAWLHLPKRDKRWGKKKQQTEMKLRLLQIWTSTTQTQRQILYPAHTPPLAYTYSFYISEIQKSIAPSSQHVVSFAHSPHPGDRGESEAAAKFHLSAGNFAAIADREVYVSCISDRWISGYAPPPPPTHAHTLTSLDNNDTL